MSEPLAEGQRQAPDLLPDLLIGGLLDRDEALAGEQPHVRGHAEAMGMFRTAPRTRPVVECQRARGRS